MAYYLGVDIGTTYTAAAIWRDGRVEISSLGNRAPVIPSVVFLREDGAMLIGEAAARRGSAEPQRVAREFKRRIGDPTPIIVGGTPFSADALIGKMLGWVVGKVTESEGGPPDHVAISHPANWGSFKKDLLRQAIRRADLDDVRVVTEPEAAAIHYASQARIGPGAVIAVYDLGGGTFDVALLRKRVGGWDILGEPEGIERLGGVDFDEAVFRHVAAACGGALDDLDPDDAAAMAAVSRLRQECIEAKEALSGDLDVDIPVLLPTFQTEVRLTRAEFEQMIRPTLADSIAALNRALRSAKVEPTAVTAVLLVGGSSRIPLVGELVSSQLGRPVAVDAHPKYGIALGAAILAADHASAGTAVTTEVRVLPEHQAPAAATAASAAAGTDSSGGVGLGTVAAAAGLAAGAGAVAGAALAGSSDPSAPAVGGTPISSGNFPASPGAPSSGGVPAPAAPGSGGYAAAGTPRAPGTAGSGGFPAAPAAPAAPPAEAPPGSGGFPSAPAAAPTPAPAPTAAPAPAQPTSPTAPAGAGSGGYNSPPLGAPAQTQAWSTGSAGSTGQTRRTDPAAQRFVPAPPEPSSGGNVPGSGGFGAGGHSGGGRGNGGAAPKRNIKPMLVGAAAVILLIAAVGYVLTLGGDDDPGTTAGSDTTAAPSQTTAAQAETTAPPETTPSTEATPSGPFVTIDSVEVQDGNYLVNFSVSGFTPSFDQGGNHTHFFLNTTPAAAAGSNGLPEPGDWDLTDQTGSYLTKYGPGTDATQMCALVADSGHRIAYVGTETGNCVDLPAG
jgi:actin-like ATPase involved in cell morphogenesis